MLEMCNVSIIELQIDILRLLGDNEVFKKASGIAGRSKQQNNFLKSNSMLGIYQLEKSLSYPNTATAQQFLVDVSCVLYYL